MTTTKIEWTHRADTIPESWNFIAGCEKVSPGCNNCYAESMSWRIANMPDHPERYDGVVEDTPAGARWTGQVNVDWDALEAPLRWQKPRTVFVCSMSDLFHPDVPAEAIQEAWRVMAKTPQHTYQVLTKRSHRMSLWLRYHASNGRPGCFIHEGHLILIDGKSVPWPLPNVWVGVTVESWDLHERLDHLVDAPAALRFVSIEPMLTNGLINLSPYLFACPTCGARRRETDMDWTEWRYDGMRWQHHHDYPLGHVPTEPEPLIDWVILGGESGPRARPFCLHSARRIVADCQDAGVAVFLKQLGSDWVSHRWEVPAAHSLSYSAKGANIDEWPADLQVREFPAERSASDDQAK